MLAAISANFSDLWRSPADKPSLFHIQMTCRDTQRRLGIATENQGVPSSNLALGTSA